MPGQVPPGGPPPMPPGQPMPGSMGAPMLPPDPVAIARAKAADMFTQAVALLKNDKLRGFRIDIETDSIVEPDQQAMQQARTELLGAIAQFLPQAIQAGMAEPALKPLMGKLLLFFLRGFKASRDIEAAFEQTIDDMTKEAANPAPKPPSPEEIKAKAEMDKAALAAQTAQQDAQSKAAQSQLDMQLAQQKHDNDMAMMQAEMQIKQQELAMEQQRLAMEERQMQVKAQMDERTAAIQAAAGEREAALNGATMERKHELGIETLEAKAAQAKKPNGAAKK